MMAVDTSYRRTVVVLVKGLVELIAQWREEARLGRGSMSRVALSEAGAMQSATILAKERCADELAAALGEAQPVEPEEQP